MRTESLPERMTFLPIEWFMSKRMPRPVKAIAYFPLVLLCLPWIFVWTMMMLVLEFWRSLDDLVEPKK